MINNAIILAAGYGTRLGMDISKPLIKVGNQPIILYILKKLGNNVANTYIVTNNRYFENYRNFLSLGITLINDGTNSNEERLGALKDLELVLRTIYPDQLGDTLVILGDNLFEDNLSEFFKNYNNRQPRKPLIGVYDVCEINLARKYGIVEVSESEKIIGFEEKPKNPKTTLASTGIYLFPPEDLELLNVYLSDKNNSSDGPGNFISWLVKRGNEIYAYKLRGKWWDIGSVESLEDARSFFNK